MAGFDLIPAEAYESLPSEPTARFLAMAAVAETRLLKGSASENVRKRFMGELAAAASELGVGKLPAFPSGLIGEPAWESFLGELGALKTRLRLRTLTAGLQDSVGLALPAKAVIEHEVEILRRLIIESNLPEGKKSRLQAKLNEFIEELHRKRLGFAKLAAVAAAVAGVFGGTSVGLANAPKAMQTIGKILQLVGEAKSAEEEDQLLISPPLQALPAPGNQGDEETGNADIA